MSLTTTIVWIRTSDERPPSGVECICSLHGIIMAGPTRRYGDKAKRYGSKWFRGASGVTWGEPEFWALWPKGPKEGGSSSDIVCPFCGETDFDESGLKIHLNMPGWCKAFEEQATE